MLYRIHLAWAGFKLAKVGTDCIVFINPTTIRLLCLAKSVKGLIIHKVRKCCLSAGSELTLPLSRCWLKCTSFYTSRCIFQTRVTCVPFIGRFVYLIRPKPVAEAPLPSNCTTHWGETDYSFCISESSLFKYDFHYHLTLTFSYLNLLL
jgi:hypothetical protein